MNLTAAILRQIIKRNGHLVQEGNETKSELMEAVTYLRSHTEKACRRPSGESINPMLERIASL